MYSFSQNFEDVYIYRAFRDVENGFYIDAGAFDPIVDSVTKMLYDLGWSGVNLEPGPSFPAFASRSRDINLPYALSGNEGEIDFHYIPSDPGASTTEPRNIPDEPSRVRSYKVIAITLEAVVRAHAPDQHIHFLKLDIEGAEWDVLRSTDWRAVRPELIITESSLPYTNVRRDAGWADHMKTFGYEEVFFDGINTYYLREESLHRRDAFKFPVNVLDGVKKFDPYQHHALNLSESSGLIKSISQEVSRVVDEGGSAVRGFIESDLAPALQAQRDLIAKLTSDQSQHFSRLQRIAGKISSSVSGTRLPPSGNGAGNSIEPLIEEVGHSVANIVEQRNRDGAELMRAQEAADEARAALQEEANRAEEARTQMRLLAKRLGVARTSRTTTLEMTERVVAAQLAGLEASHRQQAVEWERKLEACAEQLAVAVREGEEHVAACERRITELEAEIEVLGDGHERKLAELESAGVDLQSRLRAAEHERDEAKARLENTAQEAKNRVVALESERDVAQDQNRRLSASLGESVQLLKGVVNARGKRGRVLLEALGLRRRSRVWGSILAWLGEKSQQADEVISVAGKMSNNNGVQIVDFDSTDQGAFEPQVSQANQTPMTFDSLMDLYDEEFVKGAYQLLLNRHPDSTGLRHYTRVLRRGGSRVGILADLSGSAEAAAVKANIPGLRTAIRRQRRADLLALRPLRYRLFGSDEQAGARLRAIENRIAAFEKTVATLRFATLSPVGASEPQQSQATRSPIRFDDLMDLYDEEFVKGAYQLLLSRDADSTGLRHYTRVLRRGGSRVGILADLSRSAEAAAVRANVPGLRTAIRRQRRADLLALRPLRYRLFGSHEHDSARLRAIENRIAAFEKTVATLRFATLSPAKEMSLSVPCALSKKPDGYESAALPVIALDTDRMIGAEHWPDVSGALFSRHWPEFRAKLTAKEQNRGVLWIAISGPVGSAASPETLASIEALSGPTAPGVTVVSLGPEVGEGATALHDLKSLAAAVPDDALVLFVGAKDVVDPRLADVLTIENGWKRDFILSDQLFVDLDRVGPIFFHGIDLIHLRHADYFSSRFALSSRQLKTAVGAGAVSSLDVARWSISNLDGKESRKLHLQYPFITNGDLDLKTLRSRRLELMKCLKENAPSLKGNWKASTSVVVCTKDGGYLLDGLVQHLLAMPQVLEVLIVSNNSTGDYTVDLLDRLSETDRCSVFRYDRPFNFSVQCNLAVSQAMGQFLLFLNDDVSLIGEQWLTTLLSDVDAEQPRVAGPLMLYPDQSIQQGGMFLGHNNVAGHTYRHLRHPHDALMYELVAPRQVSCITGACLLMKRDLFDNLNGFDEQLASGLQDVDLCLRALHSGAVIVFDPRAIIFHLESVSLISMLSDAAVQRQRDREYERFRERWHVRLKPDRWHSRNFCIDDETLRLIRIAG